MYVQVCIVYMFPHLRKLFMDQNLVTTVPVLEIYFSFSLFKREIVKLYNKFFYIFFLNHFLFSSYFGLFDQNFATWRSDVTTGKELGNSLIITVQCIAVQAKIKHGDQQLHFFIF